MKKVSEKGEDQVYVVQYNPDPASVCERKEGVKMRTNKMYGRDHDTAGYVFVASRSHVAADDDDQKDCMIRR